jgi:hypothetical protein
MGRSYAKEFRHRVVHRVLSGHSVSAAGATSSRRFASCCYRGRLGVLLCDSQEDSQAHARLRTLLSIGVLAAILASRLNLPSVIGSVFIGIVFLSAFVVPTLVVASDGGFVTRTQIVGWGSEPRSMNLQRRFMIGLLSIMGALAIGVVGNLMYDSVK